MKDDTLPALVEQRSIEALAHALARCHPADVACFIRSSAPKDWPFIFSALSDPIAAQVFQELDPVSSQALLRNSTADRISRVCQHMEIDDATDLLSSLTSEQCAEVLAYLPDAHTTELETALGYAPHTAGRLMTSTYVSLSQSMRANQAVLAVREQVAGPGDIFYLYVTDADVRLIGVLSIRALLLAARDDLIGNLCDTNVVRVNVAADREEVARTMAKYDLLIVPVVDNVNHLVGVVTIDDALDVLEEEATEDLLRLSGTFEPARDRPRSFARVLYRLPWLLVTVVGELAVALVLAGFISQIERVIALALFIPIVSATAGSVGIQSLAVSLAAVNKDAPKSHMTLAVLREARDGLLLGLVSGLTAGSLAILWKRDITLGLVIASSILLSLTVAAVLGASLPTLLTRLRANPAIASGPLITTLNDALSLSIYLAVAGWLLAIA